MCCISSPAVSTVTTSSSSSTSYSQPEDMHKVQEKLTQQMSTLATERHIAEPPPKSATRGTYSSTGTDSSSNTLREDGSIESLSSLVNDTETASRDAKIDASGEKSSEPKREYRTSTYSGSREGSRTGSKNSSFKARDLVRFDKKYTSKYDTTGDAKLSSSYPMSEGRSGIRDYTSRSATIERYSSYASRGSKDTPKPSELSGSDRSATLDNRTHRDTSKLLSRESNSLGKNQLSPKSKHKHRPTTPEPLSPVITDAKLLQIPERRARRKSEGMMPIPHFKMDAKKSETLVEEEDGACSSPVSKEVPTGLDSVSSPSVVEDGVQGKKLEKGVKPSGGEKLIESGGSSPTKSRNSSSENLRFSPSLVRRSRNLDSGSESPSSRTKTFSRNLRYSPTISRRARGEAKTFSSENLQNSLASSPTSTVRPGSRSQGNSSDAVAAAASSPTEAAPTSSQTTPRPTLSSENLRHSPVISRRNRNDGSSLPTKAYSREGTQPTDTTSFSFSTRTSRYDGTSSPTKARTFGRKGLRLSDRTSTLDTTRSSRYEGATSPVKSTTSYPSEDSTASVETIRPSSRSRNDGRSSPSARKTLSSENVRSSATSSPTEATPPNTKSDAVPAATEKSSSRNSSPTTPTASPSNQESGEIAHPNSRNRQASEKASREITVKCGEEEVKKDLFPLPRCFMREHAPFNVIYTEPERPWRLAVGQDRKIYFTGNKSTSFSVLSPGEEQPMRVQCEDIMFARGIAVTTEGGGVVVYITGNHKLQKYKDGRLIAQLGNEGLRVNQFSDPNGVRVYNDRVYVCDSGNSRIQVFSRDLRERDTRVICSDRIFREGYVYESSILFHPEDLDFDDKGKIYVANSHYHSVVVFTPSGEYMCDFPLTGLPLIIGLPFPVSIRIFKSIDERAYFCVSAWHENCIIVCTLHGEFVRKVDITFDENRAPGRGSLMLVTSGTHDRRSISYVAPRLRPTQPLGLAVDCNGFLYVACFKCNQIQVFE